MNTRKPCRRLAVRCGAFFALAFVFPCLGGEAARPDAARIKRLAKQLGAEDCAARQHAMETLRKIGPDAWPLLKPHLKDKNTEQVARLRQLAGAYGVLLEDQRERAKQLLAKLESNKIPVRDEGFSGLLALGPAGVRLLRERLSGKSAKPVVWVETPELTGVAGHSVKVEGSLINEGEASFWVKRRSSNSGYSVHYEPFGKERLLPGTGMGGGSGRRSMGMGCGGFSNRTPLANWRVVGPGQQAWDVGATVKLKKTGLYKVSLSTTVPSGAIKPHLPGSGQEVTLEINKALTKAQKDPSGAATVFSLPDFKKLAPDSRLGLTLAAEGARAVPAGGKLALTVTLRPKPAPRLNAMLQLVPARKYLRLERNLARYAWYAVLDAKKIPRKWGSWYSVLAAGKGKKSKALAARSLALGQSASWKLAVPLPDQAGRYTLIAGYEVPGPEGITAPPQFGGEDEEDYAKGAVYARLAEFQVSAPAPAAPAPPAAPSNK